MKNRQQLLQFIWFILLNFDHFQQYTFIYKYLDQLLCQLYTNLSHHPINPMNNQSLSLFLLALTYVIKDLNYYLSLSFHFSSFGPAWIVRRGILSAAYSIEDIIFCFGQVIYSVLLIEIVLFSYLFSYIFWFI